MIQFFRFALTSVVVGIAACTGSSAAEPELSYGNERAEVISDATSEVALALSGSTLAVSEDIEINLGQTPIRGLLLSPSERRAIHDVVQKGILQCMKERGFEYDLLTYDQFTRAIGVNESSAPVADPDRAYHGPLDTLPAPHPNDARVNSSPEYATALLGDSYGDDFNQTENTSSGCWNCAVAKVIEPDGAYAELDEMLIDTEIDINIDLETSSFFDDANQFWSSCMEAGGYAYDRPVDASERFAVADTISEEERSTFMADVACRSATGYDDRIARITQDAEQSWINSNPSIVEAVADAKAEIIQRLETYASELGTDVVIEH